MPDLDDIVFGRVPVPDNYDGVAHDRQVRSELEEDIRAALNRAAQRVWHRSHNNDEATRWAIQYLAKSLGDYPD